MTFSIVARDPRTGDLGIAVASRFLAVGSVVPWAAAGVGAIATQAYANVRYGPDGLARLAAGEAAPDVLAALVTADALAGDRQAGVVDASGRAATHTGATCLPWAGGLTGDGVAIQGNILVGAAVVESMAAAFAATPGPALADRLVAALLAGDRAGGDARGRQSAALLVVRVGGGYGGGDDRFIDLRVDDHPDPVVELERLVAEWRLLLERPTPDELLEIDASLAAELRAHLTALGWAPGRDDGLATALRAGLAGQPRIGVARPPNPDWDEAWDGALLGWMAFANLEERAAAPGLLDPAVLRALERAVLRD